MLAKQKGQVIPGPFSSIDAQSELWRLDTSNAAGRYQSIRHKHCDRHWADAARNRRNRAGVLPSTRIVDVADEAGLAFALFRRGNAVDADVNDGCAFLDPVALDHLRTANRCNDDIRR